MIEPYTNLIQSTSELSYKKGKYSILTSWWVFSLITILNLEILSAEAQVKTMSIKSRATPNTFSQFWERFYLVVHTAPNTFSGLSHCLMVKLEWANRNLSRGVDYTVCNKNGGLLQQIWYLSHSKGCRSKSSIERRYSQIEQIGA